MARVTVEDCVDKVDSRFELVLLASHRARQISGGAELTLPRDNDKYPVVALREIAEQTLSPADLEEDLIHSLQRQVEVDEPEGDFMDPEMIIIDNPVDIAPDDAVFSDSSDMLGQSVTFDSLSEEELLAGIENLVPPEKSDDF